MSEVDHANISKFFHKKVTTSLSCKLDGSRTLILIVRLGSSPSDIAESYSTFLLGFFQFHLKCPIPLLVEVPLVSSPLPWLESIA